ncbi:unnamed protein product, partial [Gulo gulo]
SQQWFNSCQEDLSALCRRDVEVYNRVIQQFGFLESSWSLWARPCSGGRRSCFLAPTALTESTDPTWLQACGRSTSKRA